jgi:glycosyltransferase involved in cell wall biosynthesis
VKILHIAEYAKGGVATYLNQILPYQQEMFGSDNIYLAVSDINSEQFDYINNENQIRYRYKRNLFGIIQLREIYKEVIKNVNPDIIHVHSTFAGFGSRLIKRGDHQKLVYTPHGWSFNQDTSELKKKVYTYIERKLTKKTDIITDISRYEMGQAILRGIDSKKIKLIYNGISEQPNYIDIPAVYNKRVINMLFIGRFDRQKGLDYLLEVFEQVTHTNLSLNIIGENVISNNSPTSENANVNLIGKVDNSSIDSYIRDADVIILPSRWEGFGLVAIEAMRNKKACIVSNRGALPELVKHEENGYVFDFNNQGSLISILNQLDRTKLKQMGEEGHSIFKQLFTSKQLNNELIKVYREVSDDSF